MKIGITMYSFHRTFKDEKIDIQQFIEYCGEKGFDSLDLVAYFWKDREREEAEIPGWIEKAGIKLLTYSVGNHLLTHDAKKLAEQMDVVRDGIRTAAKLGAPYVRVFGGNNIEGFTSATALKHIIDCFKSVMPMCAEHDVTLCIENHGGYPGTAIEMKMVVEGVGDERFKALFDTGNWLRADQDPIQAAKELVELVGLTHVKDMIKLPADSDDPEGFESNRSVIKLKKATVGEGDVHNAEVIKVLAAGGFDGYATIEGEGPGDEFANAERSLAYMRKAVAEL